MLLEDMLVIDAATIYPRLSRCGALYSLDIIDGATITPLVGEDGRAPEAPDPAYQQILHGIPAADFSCDELLYLPRNVRAHRLYGMSPVEQIALTINIALRRDAATLEYYRSGSLPDSFATLPKEWTVDQISQFQDYFDALMAGNSSRRRMLKFMPSDFRLQEVRQAPLKDQYDEWLARLICYAFSVPVTPFVGTVNRATSETLRLQATQEGLIPLRAWIKDALDRIIQTYLAAPDLEFVWVGDDAIDPLQQAQTLQILVGAGIKTKDEARAELGLAAAMGDGAATVTPVGLGKFNPHHDRSNGQFTTADEAGARTINVSSDGADSVAALRMRAKIVRTAHQYIFSTDRLQDNPRAYFDAGKDKCNLFVYEILTEAGASPGLPNPGGGWWWNNGPYPPLAGQWADPNYTIKNWRMLSTDETPLLGDVAAERIDYRAGGTGHVMIVGEDNTFIGTGSPPGHEGTIEQIPARTYLGSNPNTPHGPIVYRRWVAP